ncbi:MAG TPA: sugar phosphate nucleotidyltransferase [Thermoanaerobaculia bacterium]|nr:sugar phosphate nucleotidyltransferase [Thermoanaerobaculia bacterium]
MSAGELGVLILAGGSGTRFWPLSRADRPKQLLALEGETSLLRATFERVAPSVPADRVWVCTTRRLAARVREELPEVAAEHVLAEPEGRNTAPAIAWSLARLPASRRDLPLAVLPSDHWVADAAAFRRVLEAAARAVAARDAVLTLGVTPHRPETGYGYLELSRSPGPGLEPVPLARFVEKPDEPTARAFVETGRYLWNAGIFVFRPGRLLELLAQHQPAIAARLDPLVAARDDPDAEAALYGELPVVSIDSGLIERLDAIETLPLDCGWSDLGSWEALAEALEPNDARGNRLHGPVVTVDARENLLYADHGTVAVIGVEGLVVVRTADAVLVMPRERAQDVRRVVDELRDCGRDDLL